MTRSESDAIARYLAGVSVSGLGTLLLFVPLYDIYDDLTVLSWSVTWTLVENSAMLFLAVGLVVAGAWLVRSDWETAYVLTVARWTVVVTGIVAGLIAWVLSIQLSVMGRPKPYALALNGILFGGVTAFGIGVYSARQRMITDELEARERHLRAVYAIIGDSSRSYEQQAEAILDRTRALFDADAAVFGRVDDHADEFELTAVAGDRADLAPGDRVPVEETHLPTLTTGGAQPESGSVAADPEHDTFDLGLSLESLGIGIGNGSADGDESAGTGGGDRAGDGNRSSGSNGDGPTLVQRTYHADPEPKAYGTDEGVPLHAGTPLYVNDQLHGAVCFLGSADAEETDGWRAAMVALLRDWLTHEIHRQHLVEKLEDRLAERDEQFASIADAVDEYAIFTLDADGMVTTWNHGAEGILGYGEDEAVGGHVDRFLREDRVTGGDDSGRRDGAETGVGTGSWSGEFGEPATIRGEQITPLSSDELLARAAARGQVTAVGWCSRADGSRFPASVTVAARYDDADDLVGFTTVTQELTKQYRFERTIEQERARLEFVNRMIRHNILNGLNLVNARVENLETTLAGANAEKDVDVIRDRVDDMADLIDTMRTMMDVIVSEADHEPDAVPIRLALEREIDLLRDAYPDAQVDVHDLPAESVTVVADEILGELFENVLSNAVVHNDERRPEIEVWTSGTTRELPVDPERETVVLGDSDPIVAAAAAAEAGEGPAAPTENDVAAAVESGSTVEMPALTVHVADNGPGIPDEDRSSVLERGVSNLDDPGTGFGLYVVKEMMRAYGGTLAIRDNDPTGTVFDLTFLRADVDAAERLDCFDDESAQGPRP